MTQKLMVHANDEVYKTTVEKMSQVEEESKKARLTKLLHFIAVVFIPFSWINNTNWAFI